MMALIGRDSRMLGLLLLTALLPTAVHGLEFNICADINTSDNTRNISIYQTNGLCHDFCIQDYAYAITQDNACWCSNYTPAKSAQVDGGRCSQTCPAFPSEHCGGPDAWSYVVLPNVLPSGTRGASGASSTKSTSDSESSTPTQTSSMVQTVTTGGIIKTVTVGSTNPTGNASGEQGASHSNGGGGLGTGAVVGIVVGVIGAVLIAAGLILFFFLRRKKQQRQQEGYQEDPSVRGSSPSAMGSGSNHQEMAMAAGVPSSPNSAGKRSSTLGIDPRMDPFKQGLYMRNGSHESVNTLRDDHDYSRRIQHPKVLRATNPDPDAGDD